MGNDKNPDCYCGYCVACLRDNTNFLPSQLVKGTDIDAAYDSLIEENNRLEGIAFRAGVQTGEMTVRFAAASQRAEKAEQKQETSRDALHQIANWVFGCDGHDTAAEAASGMNALAEHTLQRLG